MSNQVETGRVTIITETASWLVQTGHLKTENEGTPQSCCSKDRLTLTPKGLKAWMADGETNGLIGKISEVSRRLADANVKDPDLVKALGVLRRAIHEFNGRPRG